MDNNNYSVCTVEGFRRLDFTAPDGKKIFGATLYYSWQDPNIEGRACDHFFVNGSILAALSDPLSVGSCFIPIRDAKGRIKSLFIVSCS